MFNINKTIKMSDLIYGLADVLFEGESLGYIEKGSFDHGGEKGEVTEIFAEQVLDAPVEVIATSNATIKPTFNLIKLNFENFQKVLGGTLVTSGTGDDLKVIGWSSPVDALADIRGEFLIKYRSGKESHLPYALLLANFAGKATLTEASKLECQLYPIKSEGKSSYSVYNEGTITEGEA